jgi:hypothetical protein
MSMTKTVLKEDVPPSNRQEIERKLALAKSKGYAITPDDVKRRFGDQPLTPQEILAAVPVDSMEVTSETSDEELSRFLFGE